MAGVEPNSPASHAGVQPGDVIVGIDGNKVGTPRELAVDVAAIKPGSTAQLAVLRDGSQKTISVDVSKLSGTQTASAEEGTGTERPSIGLSLAPLTPDMQSQLNLPSHTAGAVVADVQAGSAADQAGLRQGDVIVGVGTHAVELARAGRGRDPPGRAGQHLDRAAHHARWPHRVRGGAGAASRPAVPERRRAARAGLTAWADSVRLTASGC